MAFWQSFDFLFCGLCGTLLRFDSVRCATCPLCGFKRKAKEIAGKETWYSVDVEVESALEEVAMERPLLSTPCPKCGQLKVRYYSRQMRSADEGQTVFNECGGCGHNWSENT
ncbi:hypothetical protein EJB05_04902 [Eragrostis curvula]|uniref:DNA-directed RNA polymerase subunit n=1 Tax=Eragrostis curvula TaxID=38414 RepID=A0A5J9WBX5_9POAL|nr:hypothetical protein EJB05_04902 [Eragrostis curvula]